MFKTWSFLKKKDQLQEATETKEMRGKVQRAPETRCGELHIPYVQHYSTLSQMGSCGGEPFQPFHTNGLTESRTSEHLYYILSVLWETGLWWEWKRETDMEKNKRQKKESWERFNSAETDHQNLCSLCYAWHTSAQQLNFSETVVHSNPLYQSSISSFC